jgi:hypothetical protein
MSRDRHRIAVALCGAWLAGASACGGGGDHQAPAPGPSAAQLAADGERAFFDTLYNVTDRADETIVLLEGAVTKNPADGRSFFLLGMLHMFRFAQNVSDFHYASDALKREVAAAQSALDRAVPLLPQDRRVPGFRGAATYVNGVVQNDPDRVGLGLAQLRDAVQLYPEFNSFSFVGTVANIVPPSDPLFAEALSYIGDPLRGGCTPFNQPEICGNAGKAPHNVQGALVLFGDLFAKGGNLGKAKTFYQLALSFPDPTPWRFRSVATGRLQTAAERVALYEDDDLRNDPPLIGYRGEACAACHYK